MDTSLTITLREDHKKVGNCILPCFQDYTTAKLYSHRSSTESRLILGRDRPYGSLPDKQARYESFAIFFLLCLYLLWVNKITRLTDSCYQSIQRFPRKAVQSGQSLRLCSFLLSKYFDEDSTFDIWWFPEKFLVDCQLIQKHHLCMKTFKNMFKRVLWPVLSERSDAELLLFTLRTYIWVKPSFSLTAVLARVCLFGCNSKLLKRSENT